MTAVIIAGPVFREPGPQISTADPSQAFHRRVAYGRSEKRVAEICSNPAQIIQKAVDFLLRKNARDNSEGIDGHIEPFLAVGMWIAVFQGNSIIQSR